MPVSLISTAAFPHLISKISLFAAKGSQQIVFAVSLNH
ncbi:hypothetical protein l11_15120 [Neisseria weaveri LMG 5135]|nr:hypothetical protein l13_16280 [Neisseria weaveri ATCC 51223]EGV36936.1 hypothetical protein l11_15120 [Neisseria weaveri LMG 5135]